MLVRGGAAAGVGGAVPTMAQIAAAPELKAAYGAPTRTGLVVLSTPMTAVNNLAEMCWRLSSTFQDDAVQVRLRVRNASPLAEATALFGASFTATYAGPQALDVNGAPTGAFTGAPVQMFPAFTLPADGSEYVSDWSTAAGALPKAGKPWLFSFAYTGGATSGGGQRAGTVNVWYDTSVGSSSKVAQTATLASSGTTAPFDVRVEVQYPTRRRVGVAVGDSITWGTGGAAVPKQFAYPEVYSALNRVHLANAGIPSSTLANWAGPTTDWKWQRLSAVLSSADFVTIALGTNSLAAGAPAMQASFLTVLANVRALVPAGTPILGCTLEARNLPHSRLAANAAAAATTLVLNDGSLPSGAARLGEGPTLETVTVSANPTGTGPYTYTVTALANAHGIGETVARGTEVDRLNFNAWLRGLPGGIAGVVDHERATAASYDRSILQPELGQSDGLHPTAAGSNALALAIPVLA